MKKIIIFFALLQLTISCSNRNKIEIEDDRLLNNPIVCHFIDSYFSHNKLAGLKYFNLDVTERLDSLNILIYPIVQKSDSIGEQPLSLISYGKKIIFLRAFPSYYLYDIKSETLLKYRDVIRITPDLCKQYTEYPRWKIRIKNSTYRIDSLSSIPHLKGSVKYVAPPIPTSSNSR